MRVFGKRLSTKGLKYPRIQLCYPITLTDSDMSITPAH